MLAVESMGKKQSLQQRTMIQPSGSRIINLNKLQEHFQVIDKLLHSDFSLFWVYKGFPVLHVIESSGHVLGA